MIVNIYIIVLIVLFVDKVRSAYIVGWVVENPRAIEHLKINNPNMIVVQNNFAHHQQPNSSHLNINHHSTNNHQLIIDQQLNHGDRPTNHQPTNPHPNTNHELIKNLLFGTNQVEHKQQVQLDHQLEHNQHSSNETNGGDLASIGLSTEDRLICETNSDCLSVNKEMYCGMY